MTSQTRSKRISHELVTSILRGEIPAGTALPSEEELQKELEREREWFIREQAVRYST